LDRFYKFSKLAKQGSIRRNNVSFTNGIYSCELIFPKNGSSPAITAAVPLTKNVNYSVKFKYKYLDSNYGGQHPITIQIIKNGSATTLTRSTFASNNDWSQVVTSFIPDQTLEYDFIISLFSFDAEAYRVLIDEMTVSTSNNVGVNEVPNNLEQQIAIFPSVTTDFVTLKTDVSIDINKITISNSSGMLINKAKAQDKVLDFSKYPSGLYFISIETSEGRLTKKIIKA
jgi:Secretion system C-terminal sorting domain